MNANVWMYEPQKALFVTNDDPLQFYKAIISYANQYLKNQGCIFFETHFAYTQVVAQLLKKNEFDSIVIKKDMSSNERMVYAMKP
jgi:release factor glutamine methyltransferase